MRAGRELLGLLALLAAAAGVTGACARSGEDHGPDQLLRDSLGLGDGDRVFSVRVSARENRERIEPGIIWVPSGSWVQFVADDGLVHTITFELDSLASPAARVLADAGQDKSPPLLQRGARFVVEFRDAPPGRYPFRIEGSGSPARGAVVVEAEGR